MANKNTIIVHSAGGAGVSLSDKCVAPIADLGDNYPNFVFNYLDTSDANIKKIKARGEFWQIKSVSHGASEIRGSGSERSTNVADILPNVAEYLNKRGYNKKIPGEYHVIMCSASGGSGNIIAAAILQALLERDIPTALVVVGDSSNGLSAINTQNSLATFNAIANKLKKAVSIMYVNNNEVSKDSTMSDSEKLADNTIFRIMGILSIFLSSEVEDLDAEDMVNIIDQSNYKSIAVHPGLYGICFYSKEIKLPGKAIPTIGRSLTLPGGEYDTGLTLLHHKRGYISNTVMLEALGVTEQLPLHMVTYANFLAIEQDNLNAATENYYKIMDNIKQEHVNGTTRSRVDNSTGFVF